MPMRAEACGPVLAEGPSPQGEGTRLDPGLPSVLGAPASESPSHARYRVWMLVSGFFRGAGALIRAKRHPQWKERSQVCFPVTRETNRKEWQQGYLVFVVFSLLRPCPENYCPVLTPDV